MANLLVVGNSTNGGTAITTDSSGTLDIKTGTGSGTTAISIDASQAVTMPGTLAVTGAQTVGGNLTVTGTLTASGGVSGSITSGTAVSASGTSVNYTSIPAGVKRITVMFSGVSTNGTSSKLIQLGTSGGIQSTSYLGSESNIIGAVGTANVTNGFGVKSVLAADVINGVAVFCNLTSNTWSANGLFGFSNSNQTILFGGAVTLGGTLDRLRITTVNGTDSFDAGTINIFYE